MHAPKFRDRLQIELESRRLTNPRYSMRAFAAYLGADHSTLSQVLRDRRTATARQIVAWSLKLRLGAEEIAVYTHAERAHNNARRRRESAGTGPGAHQEWMAEAAEVMTRGVHWGILQRSRVPEIQRDYRQLAVELGVSVDDLQCAMTRLLRLRLIALASGGEWADLTGADALTASTFRQLALRRVRECAGISLARVFGGTASAAIAASVTA